MIENNVLLDVYLARNLGDDLFLDIFLKSFPEVKFTIINCYQNYDNFFLKYNNVEHVPYKFWDKILNKLNLYSGYLSKKLSRNNEAMVLLGGSIFIENPNNSRLYYNRKKFLKAFCNLDKPVLVIGSNFGPFFTEDFYWNYKQFFKKCYDISFRDTYSYKLFKENNRVRFNPDIVFGLDFPVKIIKHKTIGFSIIDLNSREKLKNYNNMYLNNISKLIKKAFNEGYKIVLFSFCEFEGDMNAINNLLCILSNEIKKSIEIHNYNGNLEESLNRLSEMELMVATRFHATILSQVFGQGVLPFIYSDKTMNLLNDIKLNDIFVNITDDVEINVDYLWEKIKNNKIEIGDMSKLSMHHFSGLKEYIRTIDVKNKR